MALGDDLSGGPDGSFGGTSSGNVEGSNVPDPLGVGAEFRSLMGKDQEIPGPSAEERALLREQAATLREFRDITQFTAGMQRLMLPILMQEAGFQGRFDDEGNLIGFGVADRPGQEAASELREALNERALKALRGELPSDPALVRELGEREVEMQRELIADFGGVSAARTSTPGMERRLGFERFRAETLDKARRRDIEQLVPQAQTSIAAEQDLMSQFLTRALTVGSSVTGSGFNQVQAGFGGAARNLAASREFLTQLQENRRNQTQANVGTGIGLAAALLA